jgi:hypothetical protein
MNLLGRRDLKLQNFQQFNDHDLQDVYANVPSYLHPIEKEDYD